MSDFGLQVFAADGTTVLFDSRTAQVGVIADLVNLVPYEHWERTYPAFAGRTMFVMSAHAYLPSPAAAVDYALGYPRVVIDAPAALQNMAFLVFAT